MIEVSWLTMEQNSLKKEKRNYGKYDRKGKLFRKSISL